MNTPIPTPFDIVDPPAGPIVPTLMWWLLTSLFILCLLLARWIAHRKATPPSVAILVSALLDELKRTTKLPQEGLVIERTIRLAKRIVSPYVDQEVDSLSSSEMRALAESLRASSEERDQSSGSILQLLAAIDEIAYAPRDGSTEISTLIPQLENSLEQHVRRHQPQ
jgi:hypothetical protein